MILETKAIDFLHKSLKNQKPILAFSGGKDSLVVAHLMKRVLERFDCVNECSFLPPIILSDHRDIAAKMGVSVTFKNSLPDSFVTNNPHIIFNADNSVRAWSFLQRQQRTVKMFAKEKKANISVFGRRTQENSVKATLYETKHGFQCHPIRDWTTHDVWEYIHKHSIPVPIIYGYEFGKNMGTAPFYSLNPKGKTRQQCWDIVNEIDTDQIFYKKFGHL